uniref:heparan-alpha-glucosaminide N-acetyltransferase domain-containing protein n=1 Tax=Gemmiger qucibialis TaxID=2997294 RepID=UPI004028F22B
MPSMVKCHQPFAYWHRAGKGNAMQTEQQSLRAAAGQRFWQIDALRGLALLNMLVYHAM